VVAAEVVVVIMVADPAVPVEGGTRVLYRESQIRAVAARGRMLAMVLVAAQAALESLLFAMPIHILPQHQPQDHQQLQYLVVIAFTNGLHQVQSHFKE